MVLFVAVNCSITALLLIYVLKLKALTLSFKLGIPGKKIVEFIKYGLFTLMGGVSEFVYKNVDIIMIGAMVGLSGVGIYSRAVYITAMLAIPARGFYKITYPLIADYQKSGNMEGIESFYKKVSLNNLILGSFLFLNVWLNKEFVFSLMPDEYAAGMIPLLFLAAGKLFDITTGINFQIVLTSKYYRYDTFFNVLLLGLTIGLNWIFIPLYGIAGAAVATMLTFLVVNTLRLVIVKLKFNMQPFEWSTLYVLLICILSFGITYLVPEVSNKYLDLVITSTICSALLLGPIYFFNISPDIKGFVDKWKDKLLTSRT